MSFGLSANCMIANLTVVAETREEKTPKKHLLATVLLPHFVTKANEAVQSMAGSSHSLSWTHFLCCRTAAVCPH